MPTPFAGSERTEGSGVRHRRLEVVVAPPLVRRRLRVTLGRVLPRLLPAERGDVEVRPGPTHRLVTARVDEVGAEDVAVVVADERVRAVPLVDTMVAVEVVEHREPRDVPSHARL